MKQRRILFLVAALLLVAALARRANAQSAAPTITLPSSGVGALPEPKPTQPPTKEELSLAFGAYLGGYGTNFIAQRFDLDEVKDLDFPKLVEGFSNFMADPAKGMQLKEVNQILLQQLAYQQQKVAQESNAMVAAGPETRKIGEKFLADNATAPGVIKLPSGAQYKVVKDGDGAKPATNDYVTIDLTAKLIDGTQVEKVDREFPLPRLQKSLGKILTDMKVGSHWVIYLPWDQAYGDKPALGSAIRPPSVPPYSTAIFDVILDGVRQPPPPPPTTTPGGFANPNTYSPRSTGPQTAKDVVRVPSAEEIKRGSNVEIMTMGQAVGSTQTNSPPPK